MEKTKTVRIENRLTEFDLLVAAFICFKVLGLIDWSWGKVFIPYYIYTGMWFLRLILQSINEP